MNKITDGTFVLEIIREFVHYKMVSLSCKDKLNTTDVLYIPEGFESIGDQTEKDWSKKIKKVVEEEITFEFDDVQSIIDQNLMFKKKTMIPHIDSEFQILNDPPLDIHEDDPSSTRVSGYDIADMEVCAERLFDYGEREDYDELGDEQRIQDQENLIKTQGLLNNCYIKSMIRYEFAKRILSFYPTKDLNWDEMEKRLENLHEGKIKPKTKETENCIGV